MPRHPHCVSVSLELDSDDKLVQAIAEIRQLQLEGIINSKLTIANDYFILSATTDYPSELAAKEYLDDEAMSELRRRHQVVAWSAVAAIYGDSLTIATRKKQIRKRLGGLGPLFFVGDKLSDFIQKVVEKSRPAAAASPYRMLGRVLTRISGKSLRAFEMVPNIHSHHKGVPSDFFVEHSFFGEPACFTSWDTQGEINLAEHRKGKIWFAPVVPLTGEHALTVINGCRRLFHHYGFDFASGLLLFNPRSVIAIAKITYLKADAEQSERAWQLFTALHQWCVEQGYQVYRTNVAHMEQVTECAPVYKDFLNRLKVAVDPDNIIAPGKYGVG